MSDLFFPKEQLFAPSKEASKVHILAQRFEGKCSIDAISTLMKRSEIPFSSVGFISQFLSRVGQLLPNTLENKSEAVQFVVFVGDEIFAKDIPLLITVDPISSAILRIELATKRTEVIWSKHLHAIQDNGFQARLFATDGGVALRAAHQKTLGDIPWQLDTFHGISYRLGHCVRQFEKSAYAAIEAADKREDKVASAKSNRVIEKRLKLYFKAENFSDQAIDLYDHFHYLYTILIHELNVFDSQANLRQREQVESTMKVVFELMESLNHKTINKKIASIRNALPNMLTYFDDASVAVENCQKLSSNQDALDALYLAWQWNKAVIKSKVTARKHRAIEQRQSYLELAALCMEDEEKYIELKASVYAELDQIIQASSMVECINSILRPYLNNSKNQVTQEFLNTFMFYHNHRRYHAGKRKGKTPMEILTGIKQTEDWITLLLESIEEQEHFLAA